jgi:hypothetical protein
MPQEQLVKAYEILRARGHESIRALHRTTFEFTKDSEVTPRGDCILGVKLDKAVADLSQEFKNAIKRNSAIVIIVLEVEGLKDVVLARGSSKLVLEDDKRVVVRRSKFIGKETLAIESNKAAKDIDRRLIEKLRNRSAELIIHLYVLDLSDVIKQSPVQSFEDLTVKKCCKAVANSGVKLSESCNNFKKEL